MCLELLRKLRTQIWNKKKTKETPWFYLRGKFLKYSFFFIQSWHLKIKISYWLTHQFLCVESTLLLIYQRNKLYLIFVICCAKKIPRSRLKVMSNDWFFLELWHQHSQYMNVLSNWSQYFFVWNLRFVSSPNNFLNNRFLNEIRKMFCENMKKNPRVLSWMIVCVSDL